MTRIIMLASLTVMSACGSTTPPAKLASIDPATGRSAAATAVTIHGQGLQPSFDARFDGVSTALHMDFAARLGDTDLSELVWVDDATLTATVPAGLPRGSYDLSVTLPSGSIISLANAFVVRGEVDDDAGETDE